MNTAIESLYERLEKTEYLVGNKYTLADCMAAVFIYWALKNNDIVSGTHPISTKMIAWYEKVSEREGFKETMNKSFTFGPDKLNEYLKEKKKQAGLATVGTVLLCILLL